jgi:hypothetical protein
LSDSAEHVDDDSYTDRLSREPPEVNPARARSRSSPPAPIDKRFVWKGISKRVRELRDEDAKRQDSLEDTKNGIDGESNPMDPWVAFVEELENPIDSDGAADGVHVIFSTLRALTLSVEALQVRLSLLESQLLQEQRMSSKYTGRVGLLD